MLAENLRCPTDKRQCGKRVGDTNRHFEHLTLQIGQRRVKPDLSLLNDDNMVGDPFDFRNLMTRQEHRSARGGSVHHALHKLSSHVWIQPGGGLVKNQQLGVMSNRQR